MKNKKGVEIRFMILLVLGVFVFLVLVIMMPRLLKEGSDETVDLLDQTNDYDGDGIADFYDKCDCDEGSEENDGCLTKEGYDDDAKEKCKKEIEEARKR
ncbi:hypothetical protein ACFLUF_02845 [Chloroflexota bacterium]